MVRSHQGPLKIKHLRDKTCKCFLFDTRFDTLLHPSLIMKCPYCLHHIQPIESAGNVLSDSIGYFKLLTCTCTNVNCRKASIFLVNLNQMAGGGYSEKSRTLIYPKNFTRKPIDAGIPKQFAEDYEEAAEILPISPKASAALSRRCLQHILREVGGFKARDLNTEIQMAIDSGKLPSHITESIDAIRNIGNFAAHPLKSTNTAEVLPVEPGEAEWALDVLDFLFDFYFIQPELARKRRDALNAKLAEAGKPPMK